MTIHFHPLATLSTFTAWQMENIRGLQLVWTSTIAIGLDLPAAPLTETVKTLSHLLGFHWTTSIASATLVIKTSYQPRRKEEKRRSVTTSTTVPHPTLVVCQQASSGGKHLALPLPISNKVSGLERKILGRRDVTTQ
jgi:hypothetical protein